MYVDESTIWRYLFLLCLSRQLSHLVCLGIALLAQLRHRPASFFSCRTFFAWILAASFRSAVWFLVCSYKRRASRCSSGVLLGFGFFRGFSFLGPGFLTFLSFLGFWLGAGLVSSKRCWKVLSSIRGWGGLTDVVRQQVAVQGVDSRVFLLDALRRSLESMCRRCSLRLLACWCATRLSLRAWCRWSQKAGPSITMVTDKRTAGKGSMFNLLWSGMFGRVFFLRWSV